MATSMRFGGGTSKLSTRQPKSEQTDTTLKRAKWESLREEYIDAMIHGKPITWGLLADKYGFNVQTIRNKASVEGWAKQVGERKRQQSELLDQKLEERSVAAIEQLQQDFATNEATIRKRHALMARGLQGKAMKRLQEMEMSEFKPRDVLAMLELGLREERFAMGMKEQAAPAGETDAASIPEGWVPVAEAMGGHKKVQAIGMTLLKALREMPLKDYIEAEDVEAKDDAKDAGITK